MNFGPQTKLEVQGKADMRPSGAAIAIPSAKSSSRNSLAAMAVSRPTAQR